MKKLIVKLGFLGVLSTLYIVGLDATTVMPQPRLIVACCSVGPSYCCGAHRCYADAYRCDAS